MIIKGVIGYDLICDICGHLEYGHEDFDEAVECKKENGWKSEKYRGEWEDVCPECQEG
jgi:Fe2+ or Zn2+ uptake regulation protein